MRILLVEDDPKLERVIGRLLKSEGHAVDCAGDGPQGEERALSNDYDLIILDVMLPRLDGWEVLRRLRASRLLTPVLMLTALAGVQERIKGLDLGADDYLAKPFDSGELLARIRSLTRRWTPVRAAVVEQFGVRLDFRTHRAVREGKEVSLTAKEFALLELMMMHPREVLSREQISEHVWDINFDPRSNVVESFVKFLRQKIDKGFDRSLIHTLRGAGYMFSDREP